MRERVGETGGLMRERRLMREGVDERGWGDEKGGDEKEEGMMREGSDERGGP